MSVGLPDQRWGLGDWTSGRRRALRTIVLALGILAVTVLIQATLLSRIRLLGASPNLLLVVVACWSLLRGMGEGMLWAFFGGIMSDVVSGMPLGTSSLALMGSSLMATVGRQHVYLNNVWWPALVVVLVTLLNGWITLFIRGFLGAEIDWVGSTWRIVLPEAAVNALLSVFIYPLLARLASRLQQ